MSQNLITVHDAATVSCGSMGSRSLGRVSDDVDAVQDRVRDAFVGQHPELIHTNLSQE